MRIVNYDQLFPNFIWKFLELVWVRMSLSRSIDLNVENSVKWNADVKIHFDQGT